MRSNNSAPQAWNDHVMRNNLWRRRLLCQMAPEGSYTRRVLEERSRLGEVTNNPNVDWAQKSKYVKS